MAEFFPFVLEELTREDKVVLLRHLDKINLPEERIRCSTKGLR
jgi:hypothetical protein